MKHTLVLLPLMWPPEVLLRVLVPLVLEVVSIFISEIPIVLLPPAGVPVSIVVVILHLALLRPPLVLSDHWWCGVVIEKLLLNIFGGMKVH